MALLFAKTLEEVVANNSEETWSPLFFVPFVVLSVPQKLDQVKNLTKWTKSKVKTCMETRFPNWSPTRLFPKRTVKKAQQEDFGISKKIEAKLSDGDTRRALRLLNSDDTFAPNHNQTFTTLLDRHHPHPQSTNFPVPPIKTESIQLEDPELLKALSSFYPGSAGGLDGIRPQILKDLTSKQNGVNGERLVRAIKGFVTLVLNGEIPDSIRPIFFGASLTALKKQCGGIPPIAMGSVWHRLTSKILVHRITPSLSAYLSPHQVGVGVRNGAEAGAHAARIYFNANHSSPKAFLKLDFRNAFNEIRGDSILTQVKTQLPTLFPYVPQSYLLPSNLYFGSCYISSECGVHQGDPLGPALFALTVHPIVLQLETELNVWYLDDCTIGDDPMKVVEAFRFLSAKCEEIGLQLNTSKSEVTVIGGDGEENSQIIQQFKSIAPNIKIMATHDASLLGSPLTDESTRRVLNLKTAEFSKLSRRLTQLSSHSAFFLLRNSVSTPRLIYFLRCAPS